MSEDIPSNEELKEILGRARLAALRNGATWHEAQEVAQKTVIKLMDQWNNPKIIEARSRGTTGWKNYVGTVAKNVHRDLVRSQTRRIARERRAAGIPTELPVDRPAVHRPQPRDPSGLELYMARVAVEETIATLESERQRECMTLIWVDGFSMSEAAMILELDAQTVRLHLRNARRILRRELEEPDEFDPGDQE